MSELVGPGEAARRLGVSARTVQRWLRTGRLPAIRVGDRLKVSAATLEGEIATAQPWPHSADEASRAARRRPIGLPARRAIRRVLVANRGELVPRIAHSCRRAGIRCVALV